ncbi:MAG: type I-E CRISPR-associated protein Cas6/Cse3/CasE [Ignavibacteria bacterium]|nr:type I-E CRISPR-associated protein Cas6/Cse3/CasE [Ignavibacteria bacterium]
MFISKLYLNLRSRQVQKELREPYEMHRTLAKAFSDDPLAGPERVLFRVEPELGKIVTVLVQSLQCPDWTRLTKEGYFYHSSNNAVMVKEFSADFANNSLFYFRLRANPTKRDKNSGKRIAIYGEDALQNWLNRKACQAGFEILRVEIIKEREYTSHISSEGQLHTGKHASCLFQGILRVTEQQAFNKAVEQGLGSAKGFGFGLLSLAVYTGE